MSVQCCALCLEQRDLLDSHIVPAFVGRYLRETSATGYLRDSKHPNLRRQDLFKERLLCKECEQKISAWERHFSLHSFPIFQADSFKNLEYDISLLKFAVSLSWRVLVTRYSPLANDLPNLVSKISRTMESWRRFLLGLQSSPDSEHHVFIFAGIPDSLPQNAHPKWLHYSLRGIDVTPVVGQSTLGIYVKLMRMMFYSPIVPKSPSGFTNTRIHAGAGRIISPQELRIPGFTDFLNSRVEDAYSLPISERQLQKIEEAIRSDPERVARSESLRVRLANEILLKDRKKPR